MTAIPRSIIFKFALFLLNKNKKRYHLI